MTNHAMARAAILALRHPPVPPQHGRVSFNTEGCTAGQANALALLAKFLPDRARRNFLMCGAAGTGKTHTTVEMVRGLVAAGIEVQLTATTNKAVRVLRRKAQGIDCPKTAEVFRRACTVSRFLHRKRRVTKRCRPEANEQQAIGLAPDAEVEREGYVDVQFQADDGMVVLVDEVSMLSGTDALLFEHRCRKVVFIGHRHQLPPVGLPDWLGRQTPDAELTEVVRQAEGSAIAMLGQRIRETANAATISAQPLDAGEEIMDLGTTSWEAMRDGAEVIDMILSHTNRTAGKANIMPVQSRYPGWQPGMAPPVGSLLFSHDTYMRDGRVVVGKAANCEVVEVVREIDGTYPGWELRLRDDDGEEVTVPCIGAGFGDLGWMSTGRKKGTLAHGLAVLSFGYALTCHKSQGSEWETVMLVDDYARKEAGEYRRWLYTAVTRAKKTLVYARPQRGGPR